MQDWVTTLRNTLHELKILSRGENVYCSGPAPPPLPPPPRAAARDPTSPLPPTPPTPPDRVPGIELTTRPPETIPEAPEAQPEIEPTTSTEEENIDISNWDVPFTSLPSTSQNKVETRKSVAKICGQNICLDDSMFKRTNITDSDEEFFAEIDKMLIQVSNKDPPHTAIPVLGPETDVFNFDFKQKLTINEETKPNFVNIVNTENNDYGTTFSKDSDYGHLSLTTTVSLTGTSEPEFPTFPTLPTIPTLPNVPTSNQNEDIYERLCMASTSNPKPSPLPVKKLKNVEKTRKSSLPNLEVGDSTYEYLFPSNNNSSVTVNAEINCNGDGRVQNNGGSDINRLRNVRTKSYSE
ncbi:hypothetical protein HF086_003210 [Spodoptera exigua]|uniref:Uncharacterized protein n=1 Tax=Spodoptera exigua TaxID=7107 RepID=A0A922MF04_SPOEX|nr:hypothetical protein HF086_003210 [Spodoptera exigua]